MTLADRIAPPQPETPPDGWRPRLEVGTTGGYVVTKSSAAKGDLSGEQQTAVLAEHGLSPAEWKIVGYRRSSWQRYDGEWLEAHRLSLAPTTNGLVLPDLDDLHRAVKRLGKSSGAIGSGRRVQITQGVSLVTLIADPQVGKVDSRGGTEELLARLEQSRAALAAHARKVKPDEIILGDLGDAIENFESAPGADRLNDLQLTEQIRLWRRIFWSWVDTASTLAPSVRVFSIPSNHCRVRRGKMAMGTPSDDYGIEVLAQIADIAGANPDRYSHVTFLAPDRFDESLALTLAGGKVLGAVHGNQVGSPDRMADWWSKQALGRTPVGAADFLVTGHFHNLRVQTAGDDRWWFQAPTSDSGSSWYRNISGAESAPGVMSFTADGSGWRDLTIL